MMLVAFHYSLRFLGEYDFLFEFINLSLGFGCLFILLYSGKVFSSEFEKAERQRRPWLFDKFGKRK